jgi:ankyrin repeat protein
MDEDDVAFFNLCPYDNITEEFFNLCEEENIPGLEKLIGEGFDVNKYLDFCDTPLTYSVRMKNIKIVKLLLDRGANVNFKMSEFNYSSIEYACAYYKDGESEMLNLLLEYGVIIDDKEELLSLCPEEVKGEVEEILDGVYLKPARG